MTFKIILFLTLIITISGCENKKHREFIGIKMNPVYERDLNQWALQNKGHLQYFPESYPIKINLGKSWREAHIKIRGDLARHWEKSAKSFRITLDSGSWKGMTEFDLIIPEDKAYELEPTVYEWASLLKLPVSYYEFVDVQLNHKKLGVYFLLERWTDASFEARGFKAGEVIGENNAWLSAVNSRKSLYKNVSQQRDSFNPLSVEPAIYKTTHKRTASQLAMTKFASMLKEMKASTETDSTIDWAKYIDQEAAAKWTALVVLVGSIHPVFGDNLRWVYRDENKTFSPLIYDVIAYPRKLNTGECLYGPFVRANVWIMLWMKNPHMKDRILYWMKWLSDQPDFNLNLTWNLISENFYLQEWAVDQKIERTRIKEVIKKNMEIPNSLNKRDFCP